MNQVSTIADSRLPALKEKKFDCEAESLKVVEEIVKDVPKDEILIKGTFFHVRAECSNLLIYAAEEYLKKQHFSCHHAWKTFIEGDGMTLDDEDEDEDEDEDSDSSGMGQNSEHSILDLLKDLGTVARRDVLKLSMNEFQSFYTKELMNEARRLTMGSHLETLT
jgi:hypothetical protein